MKKISSYNYFLLFLIVFSFFSLCRVYSGSGFDPVKMEMVEINFNPGLEFSNPYNTEEVEVIARFILPDNKIESVSGFWYEGFSRSLSNGCEVLTPARIKTWKIRYTPQITGSYQYFIELIDHKNSNYIRFPEKGFSNFNVRNSDKKGFLKVSETDRSYLEYSDGTFFLGLGHNLCGWEWPGKYIDEAWNGTDNKSGTYEFDSWLDKMHENKANLAQFDFCESGQLEWTYNPDESLFSKYWSGLIKYNQELAWKMDYRIMKAEEYNIFFRLTLLHWEDFHRKDRKAGGWERNPYNSENGGPLKDASGFFIDEKAKKIFKNLLRYINARWGYCKNLLCYEFWNEADAAGIAWGAGRDFNTESGCILNWHKEMASYLRSIDPYSHLLTTSFADSRNYLPVWMIPQIDLTTIHRYTYYNPDFGDEKFATVKTIQKIIGQRYSSVNKPVIVGEFALSPGGDIQRLYDKSGIEFHNQLWSSIMAKGAVSAMHWNWASYIHKNNLYYHYAPIAFFFKDIDLRNTGNFNNLQSAADIIQYTGLKKKDRAYIWVKDINNNFLNIKNGYIPAEISNQSVNLEMNDGRYIIFFYDTYNEKIIGTGYKDCQGGKLKVDIPGFKRDIAIRIEKSE